MLKRWTKMSLAGSWRMHCFSTQPRPKHRNNVLFVTSAQRKKVPTTSGIDAVVYHSVTLWSFLVSRTLDSALTIDLRVTEVVWAGTDARQNTAQIRRRKSGRTQYCVVATGLYANALLYGTSADNIHRLQVVQNLLARVTYHAPRSATASATELRQQLHFTGFSSPLRQRINIRL